eukprot:scaffold30357_cov116-Isochrysis_galbana.AAC.9
MRSTTAMMATPPKKDPVASAKERGSEKPLRKYSVDTPITSTSETYTITPAENASVPARRLRLSELAGGETRTERDAEGLEEVRVGVGRHPDRAGQQDQHQQQAAADGSRRLGQRPGRPRRAVAEVGLAGRRRRGLERQERGAGRGAAERRRPSAAVGEIGLCGGRAGGATSGVC